MPRRDDRRRLWIIGGVSAAILIVIIVILAITMTSGSTNDSGLFFSPKMDSHHSLIHFNVMKDKSWETYSYKLHEFVSEYEGVSREPTFEKTIVNCSWDARPSAGEVCNVEWKFSKTDCNVENNFGYDKGRPCVILYPKFRSDWTPEYYPLSELPEEMPMNLKDHIRNSNSNETLWIHCDGVHGADKENLGQISYYPKRGFPSYYFPAKPDIGGYLNPLVAVQFQRLKYEVVINVQCRIWAKNLPDDQGSVMFELLLDR